LIFNGFHGVISPEDRNLQRNFLDSMDNKSTSKDQQNSRLFAMVSSGLVWPVRSDSSAERDKAEICSDLIPRLNPSQIQYREIDYTRTWTMKAIFIYVAAVAVCKSFGRCFVWELAIKLHQHDQLTNK
jgi:hypothetical protein